MPCKFEIGLQNRTYMRHDSQDFFSRFRTRDCPRRDCSDIVNDDGGWTLINQTSLGAAPHQRELSFPDLIHRQPQGQHLTKVFYLPTAYILLPVYMQAVSGADSNLTRARWTRSRPRLSPRRCTRKPLPLPPRAAAAPRRPEGGRRNLYRWMCTVGTIGSEGERGG